MWLKLISRLVVTVHKIFAIPLVTSSTQSSNIFRKIYSFVFITGVVCMTTWILNGKFKTIYPTYKSSMILLDSASAILLAFLDIYDIAIRILLNEKKTLLFHRQAPKNRPVLGFTPERQPHHGQHRPTLHQHHHHELDHFFYDRLRRVY